MTLKNYRRKSPDRSSKSVSVFGTTSRICLKAAGTFVLVLAALSCSQVKGKDCNARTFQEIELRWGEVDSINEERDRYESLPRSVMLKSLEREKDTLMDLRGFIRLLEIPEVELEQTAYVETILNVADLYQAVVNGGAPSGIYKTLVEMADAREDFDGAFRTMCLDT